MRDFEYQNKTYLQVTLVMPRLPDSDIEHTGFFEKARLGAVAV